MKNLFPWWRALVTLAEDLGLVRTPQQVSHDCLWRVWPKEKSCKQATPDWTHILIKTQACQESQQSNKNVCGQFRSQETPKKRSTCDKRIHPRATVNTSMDKTPPLISLYYPRKCWSADYLGVVSAPAETLLLFTVLDNLLPWRWFLLLPHHLNPSLSKSVYV